MESEGFNVAQGARESHSHSLEAIDQAYKKSIVLILTYCRVRYIEHALDCSSGQSRVHGNDW